MTTIKNLLLIFLVITLLSLISNILFSQDMDYISIHQKMLSEHSNYQPQPLQTETYYKQLYNSKATSRNPSVSKQVYGYYPYWSTGTTTIQWNLLTIIAYFSVDIDTSGNITSYHGWPSSAPINQAHVNGVKIVLTVTLFGGTSISTLLNNPTARSNLIANLYNTISANNGDGVSIDFEMPNSSDQAVFTTFMQELNTYFNNNNPNLLVTIASPAVVEFYGGFSLSSLAPYVDYFFIMGYDYHWTSGDPGPVAPFCSTYPWTLAGISVKRSINTYISQLGSANKSKIILGVPYYGDDWPSTDFTIPSTKTANASSVLYKNAKINAQTYGRTWHWPTLTPYYFYGTYQQAWYDDEYSIEYKYNYAKLKDIGGVGMWALNYDGTNSQLWNMIQNYFTPSGTGYIPGSTIHPISITTFPFSNTNNTGADLSDIFDYYNASPTTNESGPEIVYKFIVNRPGNLTATITDGTSVDIDIHLLSALSASNCFVRGDIAISSSISPGVYYLVADSYVNSSGTIYEGTYKLDANFIPTGTISYPSPTNVLASDGSFYDNILITWSNIEIAAQYGIYRSSSSNGTYSIIGTSITNSFTDYTAYPSLTLYYYKITSGSGSYWSGLSNYDNGYIQQLSAPANFFATDGSYTSHIDLSWNVVSNALYYKVYRSLISGSNYSLVGTTAINSYVDNQSLSQSTSYYYIVKGYIDYSNDGLSSIEDLGYLGSIYYLSPSNVIASDGSFYDNVTVNWSIVSSASQYLILRSDSSNGSFTVIGSSMSNSYSDFLASPAPLLFYYKIIAGDGTRWGSPSIYDSGYIKQLPAPSNVLATDGSYSSNIDIVWDIIPTSQYYKVYRTITSGSNYTLIGTASTNYFSDNFLISHGEYYYYIIKGYIDNGNDGLPSTEDMGFLGAYEQPNNVLATDGSFYDHVDISWNIVPDASIYRIKRSAGTSCLYMIIGTSSINSYSDMYASYAPKIYYYKIQAGNGTEWSIDSSYDTGYTEQLSSPTGVVASDGNYTSYIEVRWNAISNAQYYKVYRSDISGTNHNLIGTSITPVYIDNVGLTQGSIYYYKVCGYIDIENDGLISTEDSGYLGNNANPPDTPTNVQATDGSFNDKINISWIEASNSDWYYIYRSSSSSGIYELLDVLLGSTSTFYVDNLSNNLVSSNIYYYKVKSANSTWVSADSNIDSGFISILKPSAEITGTGAVSTLISSSSINKIAGILKINGGNKQFTLTSMNVQIIKSSDSAIIPSSKLSLYKDNNNNFTIDSDDTVLGSGDFNENQLSLNIPVSNCSLQPISTANIIFTVDSVSVSKSDKTGIYLSMSLLLSILATIIFRKRKSQVLKLIVIIFLVNIVLFVSYCGSDTEIINVQNNVETSTAKYNLNIMANTIDYTFDGNNQKDIPDIDLSFPEIQFRN